MVGIFSRFSLVRGGHRRTQSAIDGRETLPPRSDLVASTNTATTSTHGIEVTTEFKPVDHPLEPLDNDQPVQCPLPEPSILNDGRIWKERVSASSMRRRSDLAIVQDGMDEESDVSVTIPSRTSQCNTNRLILGALSDLDSFYLCCADDAVPTVPCITHHTSFLQFLVPFPTLSISHLV